jgi:predicted nucleic acid-binding protein
VTDDEGQAPTRPRVYLETTVVSYLTAEPSRDLIQAAHQQVTREWWAKRRHDFDLFISQVVINEASEGDPRAAQRRLDTIRGFPILDLTEEVTSLGESLVAEGPLPEKAADDAFHLAFAVVHGVDYLVTWNCKHLANAEMLRQVGRHLDEKGYEIPRVCTPEELMGE